MSVVHSISQQREAGLDTIVSAYNDVTERLRQTHERLMDEVRRLRDQLHEKNRELARRERLAALGEMAAGVAHEIRNPLSGINLYASVLCRDLDDRLESPSHRSECRELAGKIVTGVRTLESIVGDILAFASRPCAESRPVPVDHVVGAVLDLVESARGGSKGGGPGTTIHVAPGVAGAEVMADLNQLQRAVLNITLNAIDAAGPDGQVWISVTDESGGAETSINIADNGPGIGPSILDRVFNPFFTTKDSGTGLGLAIVHGIAEAHGGRVSAETRPGGGALFRLTLRSATSRSALGDPQSDG